MSDSELERDLEFLDLIPADEAESTIGMIGAKAGYAFPGVVGVPGLSNLGDQIIKSGSHVTKHLAGSTWKEQLLGYQPCEVAQRTAELGRGVSAERLRTALGTPSPRTLLRMRAELAAEKIRLDAQRQPSHSGDMDPTRASESSTPRTDALRRRVRERAAKQQMRIIENHVDVDERAREYSEQLRNSR